MSTENCGFCRGDVPEDAIICRHCGAEKVSNRKRLCGRAAVALLGGGAVLSLLLETAPGGGGMGAYLFVPFALFGIMAAIGYFTTTNDPVWTRKS